MPTPLYLLTTVSPVNPGAEDERSLGLTRGSGVVSSDDTATVAGPTAGVQVQLGGVVASWLSPPLMAITISGTVTCNLWGSESANAANVGFDVLLERCNTAGVVQSTIVRTERGTELTTGNTVQNWTAAPTSTALSTGDRLKVTVFGNDVGTMGSGRTFLLRYNGSSASADGDAYVQVNETLRVLLQVSITEPLTVGETLNFVLPPPTLTPAIVEPLILQEPRVLGLPQPTGSANTQYWFGDTTLLTLAGTTHGLGTAALLVETYDAGSPMAQVTPGRVTVHASTQDVQVTFAQPQSGRLLLCGAQAPASHPHYAASFGPTTDLTIAGTTHGLATSRLIVQCWTDTTPREWFRPARLTVDLTTYDVRVTFAQDQSGIIVIGGYGNAGTPVNVTASFSATLSASLPGATHQLDTPNLLVQVFDASTPAALLVPGRLTLDPASPYDLTATFLQLQAGTFVVSGGVSGPVSVLHVAVTEPLTLGEVRTLRALLGLLSVTDALTLGELVVVQARLGLLSVTDGVSLAETVPVQSFLAPLSLLEPLALGEVVTLRGLTLPLSVSEPLTLDESLTSRLRHSLAVEDGLLLEDSATARLGMALQVTDGITFDELVPVRSLLAPLSLTEPLTLEELVNVVRGITGVWQVQVTEPVVLGEQLVLPGLTLPQALTEPVFLAELLTVRSFLAPLSVTDALTVGEPVQAQLGMLPCAVTDALTLGELTPVLIVVQGLYQRLVTEGLTVGEQITVRGLTLRQTVTEALLLGDTLTVQAPLAPVSVSEPLTVGESVLPVLTTSLAVSDGLTLTEPTALLLTPLVPSVLDAVSLADSPTLLLPWLVPAVSESVLLEEVVALRVPTLLLATTDALTLTETVPVQLGIEGVWQTGVIEEPVTLTETVTLRLGQLPLLVLEPVVVGDSPTMQTILHLAGSDSLTLSEVVGLGLSPLFLTVSDALSVGDTPSVLRMVVGVLQLIVVETVEVSETSLTYVATLPLQVQEPLLLSDDLTAYVPYLAPTGLDALTLGETVAFVLVRVPGRLQAVDESLQGATVSQEALRRSQGLHETLIPSTIDDEVLV